MGFGPSPERVRAPTTFINIQIGDDCRSPKWVVGNRLPSWLTYTGQIWPIGV